MKPFTDILRDCRKGEVVALCTEQLGDLIRKVQEHRKPGSFTLTLQVKPDKLGGNEVEITSDVAIKPPRRVPRPSLFYAKIDPDGVDLLRDDPDQRPLFEDTDDRRTAGQA